MSEAKHTARLPHLARQFDLMAKGCRAHGLDSWEDRFFRLYEEARDGKISAEEIVDTIDKDYRDGNDGRAALKLMIEAMLADVKCAAISKAGGPLMSDKLLPCPFCGSKFLIGQEPHDNHPFEGKFYIFHEYASTDCVAYKCRLDVRGHFDTKEDAFAFWNTRAAKAEPRS